MSNHVTQFHDFFSSTTGPTACHSSCSRQSASALRAASWRTCLPCSGPAWSLPDGAGALPGRTPLETGGCTGGAILFLTLFPFMLVFAPPVGSGLVDTMLSVRLFCAAQTGLVCSLSGKNLKSCFSSGQKTAGYQPAACWHLLAFPWGLSYCTWHRPHGAAAKGELAWGRQARWCSSLCQGEGSAFPDCCSVRRAKGSLSAHGLWVHTCLRRIYRPGPAAARQRIRSPCWRRRFGAAWPTPAGVVQHCPGLPRPRGLSSPSGTWWVPPWCRAPR